MFELFKRVTATFNIPFKLYTDIPTLFTYDPVSWMTHFRKNSHIIADIR
ncbi:hypothetical protein HXZ66_15170 [Bacillus sp. A116_S68]|nr:hypothetical protein HXZ66_15170 [Bacillus sp. A116_S68]